MKNDESKIGLHLFRGYKSVPSTVIEIPFNRLERGHSPAQKKLTFMTIHKNMTERKTKENENAFFQI